GIAGGATHPFLPAAPGGRGRGGGGPARRPGPAVDDGGRGRLGRLPPGPRAAGAASHLPVRTPAVLDRKRDRKRGRNEDRAESPGERPPLDAALEGVAPSRARARSRSGLAALR